MKYTILALALSVLPFVAHAADAAPGAPPSFDTHWRSCAKVSDCVVIDSGCGWRGINKTSVTKATEYYTSESPKLDCIETPKEKAKATCEHKLCGPGINIKGP